MVKEGGVNLISKRKARLIEFLPEKIVIKIARRTIDGYLNKYAKINEVIYKPFVETELTNAIKTIAIDYNTPDLEVGEIDWLLQSLNFNCLSSGYKYIKKAITN